MKVYGPYTRSDGRQHVIVKENGKKTTVSYPKWLMEQYIGRKLDPNNETIDHINRDFTDNRIENLRIIDRSNHAKQDSKRVKLVKMNCSWCNKQFMAKACVLDHNKKQGKSGPFCGKSCAGKYSRELQLGRISKFDRNNYNKKEYFYPEKE